MQPTRFLFSSQDGGPGLLSLGRLARTRKLWFPLGRTVADADGVRLLIWNVWGTRCEGRLHPKSSVPTKFRHFCGHPDECQRHQGWRERIAALGGGVCTHEKLCDVKLRKNVGVGSSAVIVASMCGHPSGDETDTRLHEGSCFCHGRQHVPRHRGRWKHLRVPLC